MLLYLLTTYLLLPLYTRVRNHSSYTLLPASPDAIPFARGLQTRLSNLLGHRRESFNGAESLLGDEELEEGFGEISNTIAAEERNDRLARAAGDVGSERRLSQELERGFRDSSDEDEEDERRQGRR